MESKQNCVAAGYNKAVRAVRGSVAELLEVLELEDNGRHGFERPFESSFSLVVAPVAM